MKHRRRFGLLSLSRDATANGFTSGQIPKQAKTAGRDQLNLRVIESDTSQNLEIRHLKLENSPNFHVVSQCFDSWGLI